MIRPIRESLTDSDFSGPALDVEEAVRAADQAAGRRKNEAAAPVSSSLRPTIKIKGHDRTVQTRELELDYSVTMPSPDDLLLRVEVRVDGVLLANALETRDVDSGITRLGELRITIPRHDCTVSVRAHNRNGPSEPAFIKVHWIGPETDPKRTLYVLAIGISNYKQKDEEPLQFAAKDAEDFIDLTTKLQDGLLYGHVFPHILQNNNATRKAVLDDRLD
jgi:hypothetical protein